MELEVKGSTVLSSTAHHKLRWNLDHLEVPEMETMCETKIDVERNHDHISELLSPDFRRSGCLKQSVLSSEASTPQSGSEDAVDLREVFGSLSTPLPLMKSSMSRKRTMKRSRRSDELETFIAMKNVSAASDLMAIHENIVVLYLSCFKAVYLTYSVFFLSTASSRQSSSLTVQKGDPLPKGFRSYQDSQNLTLPQFAYI